MRTSVSKLAIAVCALLPVLAGAEINKGTHLQTGGQSKVNKAMAKGYLQSGVAGMQQNQTQVNIGSKRAGTCNMNVGTQNPGDKNAKEVIVTSKEIINVCK
jgi:hypothetical protein